jgi:hypothetical protein
MRILLWAMLLGIGGTAFAAPGAGEVRFFSGVYLLQSVPGLSVAEKARRFGQLEQVTGIDARKAESILASYRARPADWRVLCDSMITVINGMQGKTPAFPVPKDYSASPGARR